MKLGFINIAKFAAVVVSMVIAGSVNAWATCPTTSPYYSPDFTANGASCLDLNSSASLPPAGASTTISAWTSTATTVTFTTAANNGFVAGEPVILSGFTNSAFFNTLVFPVLSVPAPTSNSFTVAFAVPSGATPQSETGTATPMTVLQLTPNSTDQVGSAWDMNKQPVGSSFSTTFYFQLAPGASTGDGFAFVIQDSATTALGDGGCGLGFGDDGDYGSCAPDTGGIPNSLAVVFKTSSSYASPGFYPSANSVSIQTNHASANCVDTTCNLPPGAENDLAYTNAPTLADGNIHSVTITSTTQPTGAQTACGAAPGNPVCLDVILDGTDLFPTGVSFAMKTIGVTTPTSTAWVGFTGATSASGWDVTSHSEATDILSWVFTPAGASTTGNVVHDQPTPFNFNGGFQQGNDHTSGYDFNAQLAGSATTPVTAVVTALPISSQNACNQLVQANPAFITAECFVYQNGGGQSVDVPVMFELTCPPAGECVSNTGNFPAVLGSDFAFVYTDNPTPVVAFPILSVENFPSASLTDNQYFYTTGATGLPSVGLLKGQGPDPIHPCTPFTDGTPLFQSNQISSFVFSADTSGGAKASSGNTNSCWVVTYYTQNELPTVSITSPSGSYPQNSTQTPAYTCGADNAGANSPIGPYLTVPDGSCTGPATIDTSTLGSHTYTATVTDSALNTNYSTVTYYVDAAPVFDPGGTYSATFTTGGTGSVGVLASGYPPPVFSLSNTAPSWLAITSTGAGTASLASNGSVPANAGGLYNFNLIATNTSAPSGVTQPFSLTVDQAPGINTPTIPAITGGVATSFGVTTTGYPTPTIKLAPGAPSWVSLLDNGNNTATVYLSSSSPAAGGSFPITITASNGVSPDASLPISLSLNAVMESVTVGTSPTGLSFSVDSAPYTSAHVFSWAAGSVHAIATTSQQTGGSVQNTFSAWSDGLPLSHNVTVPGNPVTYTASFNTAYLLTTAANPVAGGTVSPTSGTYYASGTVVTVGATANSGYTFSSWTGPVSGSSVTMTTPESVTANFTANPPTLTIFPTSLNFGNVNNNTSKTLQVMLTNNGATTIKISSIKIPGSNTEGSAGDADDYSLLSLCGSSILAGKSCIVYVTFSADDDALSTSAQLVITDSAVASPQSVGLSASVLDPLISLSTTSLSFGNQTHGIMSAAKVITVKNSGLTPLGISNVSIANSSSAGFAYTTNCLTSSPLAKGGTCTINVTFDPTTTGSKSGTVTITSTALNGATKTISLSGTGK